MAKEPHEMVYNIMPPSHPQSPLQFIWLFLYFIYTLPTYDMTLESSAYFILFETVCRLFIYVY